MLCGALTLLRHGRTSSGRWCAKFFLRCWKHRENIIAKFSHSLSVVFDRRKRFFEFLYVHRVNAIAQILLRHRLKLSRLIYARVNIPRS